MVNCGFKVLIEYKKESRVFSEPLQIESDCDYDLSGDNTSKKAFKIIGSTLYVYDYCYKIKNEDIVLITKLSRYSAFRFPNLTLIFKDRPLR